MSEIRVKSTGKIKLFDSDDSHYVGLQSGGTVSSNVDFTLPTADGSNGQFLKTNGSGALSFDTVSGTTINNNADNKVITGSGTANTLEAESNFIYNGTIVGAGASGSSADLGSGIHIKKADSGASALADANALVIESDADTGLSILQHTGGNGTIAFGDSGDNNIGMIQYYHGSVNAMVFHTNGSEKVRILSSGGITFNGDTATANALDDYEEGEWTPNWSATGSGGGSVSGASTNIAKYVKVGNQVTVSIYAVIQSSGTFTDFKITNLPFTQLVSGAGSAVEIGQTGTAWLLQGAAGGGTFYMKQYGGGFYNNPYLQICYTYVTS